MKKVVLFLTLFLLGPLMVMAGDYKITTHLIDSEIEIAGALRVKELIVVEGTTDFISRTVNYYSFGDKAWDKSTIDYDSGSIYNGQSIINVAVSAYEVTGKIDFNNFGDKAVGRFKELTPENKDDNVYSFVDNKDGTGTIKMFYPVRNKKIAFYLEYSISNVVVKHNDIKELNYTFKDLDSGAESTLVRLIIPYATDSELYHIWVHGNQKGKVQEVTDGDGLKLGVLGTFPEGSKEVNIRTTLPPEQVGIDMTINNSKEDALEKIIEVEEGRGKNTKKSNKIVGVVKYVLMALGVLLALGSFVLIKVKNNSLFWLLTAFGLFLALFNYLFDFHLWYLYGIVGVPLVIKGIVYLTSINVKKKSKR